MPFFEKELKTILMAQQNVKLPVRDEQGASLCKNIAAAQQSLRQQLENCVKEVDNILSSVILPSPLLVTTEKLCKEFSVFLEQLNLWQYELQNFVQAQPENIPW